MTYCAKKVKADAMALCMLAALQKFISNRPKSYEIKKLCKSVVMVKHHYSVNFIYYSMMMISDLVRRLVNFWGINLKVLPIEAPETQGHGFYREGCCEHRDRQEKRPAVGAAESRFRYKTPKKGCDDVNHSVGADADGVRHGSLNGFQD